MKLFSVLRWVAITVCMVCVMVCGGCSDDDWLKSDYAKVYLFWHRPAFNTSGYEVFVLSSYGSSHFDGRLSYKITKRTDDPTEKLLAPSPVKIDGKTTYFNQCGLYDIEINVRGQVEKITDLRYRGENTLMVSRGYGWALFISRDNWK
ncbi:MAG: hypothetical protein E7052_06245 [Lentisphaerae bacterium]|nr:hypothetical protein [Lentisphaerota bacterium]